MYNNKLYIIFTLFIFIISCASDKKSELFAKHMENNLSLDIENKDILFLLYIEQGCTPCNIEFEKYLNNNIISEDMYIIYLSAYPNMSLYNKWKNKFKEQLLWDRTNYLNRMGMNVGLGKVIWKDNKIHKEEEFDYIKTNMDNFVNVY